MVGFRAYGRCGNFMFMAAACIAYALKHGLEFSMPHRTNDPHWNPIYLMHLRNEKYVQGKEDVLLNEPFHQYQEIPFKEEWRDKQIILNGYWQSEKYFKEYRNEILYLFAFPYEMKKDLVSVHVRRGDYLHLQNKHPQIGKDWYERAMDLFPGKQFRFYSDDISWCGHTFGHRSDCSFSSNSNEIDDLIEMSCCEHNISSSSTFGWWGSWLNQNPDKAVIIPKLWFVEGYNLDTKDIVPEEWIKL